MAIIKCTCKHRWQDIRYGTGYRVHNPTGGAPGTGKHQGWRCTVCSKEKPKGAGNA